MLLSCCDKCKGLFPSRDMFLDHDARCEGNPFLSCCSSFACEREDFLRLLTQQGLETCPDSVNNDVQNLTSSVNEKSFFCEEGFNFNTHKVYRHSGSLSDYGSCENISSIPRHSISASDFGSCENISSLRSGKFVRDDLALLHSFSPTFTKDDPDIFFNSSYMNYSSEEAEKAANTCIGDKIVDDLSVSKQLQLISNNLNTDGDKHKINNVFAFGGVDNFFSSFDQREINIQNTSDERRRVDHLNRVDANTIVEFEDQNFVPVSCSNFPSNKSHDNSLKQNLPNLPISLSTLEDSFVECNTDTPPIASQSSGIHDANTEQVAFQQQNGTDIPRLLADQCLLSITLSSGQTEPQKLESQFDSINVTNQLTIESRGPSLTADNTCNITRYEEAVSPNKDNQVPSVHAGEINELYDVIEKNGRALYKCKLCGKETVHLGFLKRHLSAHNNGKEHRCPHCQFTCLLKSQLKRHLLNHKKPFLCNICAETFSDATSMNRHLANHAGEALFKCEQCEYTTNFKFGLEEHRRKHTGNYMRCDYSGCSFKTAYRRALLMHNKKHESVKQFICDVCGYSTAESGSFKRHSQVHTGLKLFKCGKCDFRAAARHEVVRHCKGKHLKEKGFACKSCSYKTSYTGDLRLHLMNHAGLNPFQCTKCQYCSLTRSKILRHIERRHPRDVTVSVKYNDVKFEFNLDDYRIAISSSSSDIQVIELTEEELKSEEMRKENENNYKNVGKSPIVPLVSSKPVSKKIDVDIGLDIGPPFDQDFAEPSLQNLIVAFQCGKCSHLFTSEEALYSHSEECGSLPIDKTTSGVDGSPFSYLLGPDDSNI